MALRAACAAVCRRWRQGCTVQSQESLKDYWVEKKPHILNGAVCLLKQFHQGALTKRELGNLSVNGSKSSTAQTGGLLLSTSVRWAPSSRLHIDVPKDLTKPTITTSDEPDTLYKRLSILVKAHDKAVLNSYEYFAVLAAKELGISINVHEPPRKIERFTLLKSVHIFKKHRVQYEMRTLYRCFELAADTQTIMYVCGKYCTVQVQGILVELDALIKLKHLTGCTANVYLEYIQRNLPEGVAMEVTKTQIQQLPEHIKEPMWEALTEEKEKSKS